jgi:hypothetical protein
MYDVIQLARRVQFIAQDIDNILEITRTSVILQVFTDSIDTLQDYIKEMADLDTIMDRLIDARKRQTVPLTQQEEDGIAKFAEKRKGVVDSLQRALTIVQKRASVIEQIAAKFSKKGISHYKSPKSSLDHSTKKVVIDTIGSMSTNAEKETEKLSKDRERQAKQLAKEREKLVKDRERQEKILAKEREKLAKERERQEKQLAKEREKLTKKMEVKKTLG